MRSLSIFVLAAALVLGVLAVIGVRSIIQNRPAAIVATADQSVNVGVVVVARHPLEFGTELTPEVLREAPWPEDARPEGSFSSVQELLANERRVALRSIAPNEPVLRDKISGYGGRAALSQIIEEGMRAVTIRVNDVSGAGGFVLPSDRVDVLHTVSATNQRTDTVTNILLQDVRVLAIDQIASENQEGAVVVKAATVEVTPRDAQKIALAAKVGELSLSLRNSTAGDDEDDATRTVRFRDLSPAQAPKTATAAPAAPSRFGSMRITRGTVRSTQSVLRERNGLQRQSAVSTNVQPAMTSTAAPANKIVGAAPDLAPAQTATKDPADLTRQD